MATMREIREAIADDLETRSTEPMYMGHTKQSLLDCYLSDAIFSADALQSLLDNKVDGCEYWASRFEMSIDAYVEVSLSR